MCLSHRPPVFTGCSPLVELVELLEVGEEGEGQVVRDSRLARSCLVLIRYTMSKEMIPWELELGTCACRLMAWLIAG